MSLTTTTAKAFMRSLLKEATAKFWTDTEIGYYLDVGMMTTWAKYTPMLYETYKKFVDFGTTISVATYTISTAIGADVYKISKILVKETGDELDYVHADDVWKYLSDTNNAPRGWTYRGKIQIDLLPTPDTTDTDYLQVYYMPTYTDITSFPDCLQPLVCIEGVIYGKTKDEDVTPDLMALRDWHEDVARIDLAMSNIGKVETWPDDLVGDYTG